MEFVSQEIIMNMYDDNLANRSVPHKYPFQLMNLYNPSSEGQFVFLKKDQMTSEDFDADFEQTLLKPSWNFYHNYLYQLASALGNKKPENYFTFYLG